MAIMAIIGELGSGKTLSLTYLAWRNWYYKRKKIYANYTLYGIPYVRIKKVSDLEKIRDGFLAYDEMFVDLEATASRSLKNRIIFNILRKSRKRNYSLVFTAQVLNTVDSRIRKILDFVAYPILNPRKTVCKLLIFNGPKPTILLRTIYFRTAPIFRMYKTEEEVSELLDDVTGIKKRK